MEFLSIGRGSNDWFGGVKYKKVFSIKTISNRKQFSNTALSDLSTLGTCDILVYQKRHKVM